MPTTRIRLYPKAAPIAALALWLLAAFSCQPAANGKANVLLKFAVSFPADRSATPLDGRILLLLSNDGSAEPRFQVSDGAATQLVFGVDVDGLAPGAEAVIDASVFGYPLPSLADLPAGEYYVQALLNRYETFRRSDGHTVKLPARQRRRPALERQAGQPLQRAREDHHRSVGRTDDPPRRWTRRSRRSPRPRTPSTSGTSRSRASCCPKFWGRPMELGACLLLPEGFDEHPDARYPADRLPRPFPLYRSTASAKSRPTRTSSPTTANASTCRATTASSRNTPTSSTRTGRARTSPGSS